MAYPGSTVLFAPEPIGGESLIGLVARAAADNRHATLAHILVAAGYPHHAHYDLAVSRPELLPGLATVLGVPERDVLTLSHPVVETPFWVSRVDFHGTSVMPCDLDHRARRVSPQSLRLSPHHRALWTHALVPYCTETGGWLISSCPDCGKDLRWYHAAGIEACGACRIDLRGFDPGGPTDEVRQQVDPVIDLLAPDAQRHAPALARLHPDLRTIGRGAAFELGWRLACAFGAPAGTAKRTMQGKSQASDKVETLREAGRMLGSWPLGVEERLAAIGASRDAPGLDRVVRRLRRDLRRRGTWPEVAGLAAGRLPNLLAWPKRARGVVLDHAPDLVGATGAGRLLGIGSKKVTALRRADRLPKVMDGGGERNSFAVYDSRALAASAEAFLDRVPIRRVLRRLGTTRHGVEQLLCITALIEIKDEAVRHVSAGVQISGRSLDELCCALAAAARQSCDDDLPLRDALRTVGGREKPYGPLLLAMAMGRLPFALAPADGETSLVDRASIAEQDVESLRGLEFDAERHPGFAFEPEMTRLDALDLLNLSAPCFMEAVAGELADCRTSGTAMSRERLLRHAADRISSMEIRHRWLGGARGMPAELKEGGLAPRLGTTGWDRMTVERLFDGRPDGPPNTPKMPKASRSAVRSVAFAEEGERSSNASEN